MAEEKYAIPASPQYSENIRKLQDTDPADACQIFNPLFSRLIENIASVKRQADGTQEAASSIQTLEVTIPAEGWRPGPGEAGEPEGFPELKTIIEDILPAHLGIEYDFWFLIWQELEDNFPSWRSIEDLELSWTQLETFVEYL